MKSHFRLKGNAPRLALRKRLEVIRNGLTVYGLQSEVKKSKQTTNSDG